MNMHKSRLGNLPKVQSGKYENRFILVGNLKTFEVSGHFTGKYFNFEAFCGKSASAITDFPLIGHQCSHKDNDSADHRPQIVIAIYKWQISHHRSWCGQHAQTGNLHYSIGRLFDPLLV
jgi:hypothetical protein